MKLECDSDEVMAILQNNETLCDAMVQFNGALKNVNSTYELLTALPSALKRMTDLVVQAVKSNTAIINSIRERNFKDDD